MTTDLEDLRDELISKAREGTISSDEAEAEAKAAGLSPLASEPDFEEFDPMEESRWSLIKAIAWIAWRDPRLVMRQGTEFRRRSTHWVPYCWRQPTSGDKTSVERTGWSLEPWRETGTLHLSVADNRMRSASQLPASAQLTPAQAIIQLWRALADEKLIAEAFDKNDVLLDVPAREWSRLALFEENHKDVLKYRNLDEGGPYHDIELRRTDVTSLWPPNLPASPSAQDKMEHQRSAASHQLIFALDETQREVVFADGPVLKGRHFDLMARLSIPFLADRSSLKRPERFEYVPSRTLQDHLRVQEHALAQCVRRIRKDIAKQFSSLGHTIDTQDVVQNAPWKGYRLNPDLWLVNLSEIRSQVS